MFAGVEDGDFGGEVLCLEDDGRRKVGQRAVVGDFPLCLHRLRVFIEQGMVALATDQREVLLAAGLLGDNIRALSR